MLSLRLYLVRCAQARLRAAEQNLHLFAGLDQLHVKARNDLARAAALCTWCESGGGRSALSTVRTTPREQWRGRDA